MKIVTFGSCLSRNTADQYKLIFGGDIVSCVYHNRSDQFLSYFVDKSSEPVEYDFLRQNLAAKEVGNGAPDGDPLNILRNQYKEWIGTHKLPGARTFFDVMATETVDLVILDNFMDTAGRLSYLRHATGPRSPLFLRPADFASGSELFELGDFLDPLCSAANWSRIVKLLKQMQPAAVFAFLQFPYNTYVDDKSRHMRSTEFAKHFKAPGCYIVPPLFIRTGLRTDAPSHFKQAQYAAYAGMIHTEYVQKTAKPEKQGGLMRLQHLLASARNWKDRQPRRETTAAPR